MKLTVHTDYTLRVLMYLSLRHESGALTTIDEIAAAYDISRSHLMKIVHQMGAAGLLETVRGRSGGVRLARDPAAISIGMVVRVAEGDFALVECFEAGKEDCCAISPACNLTRGLRRALDAFMLELDRMTLRDAVAALVITEAPRAHGGRMKMGSIRPARRGVHRLCIRALVAVIIPARLNAIPPRAHGQEDAV
jgi:Rrf2 family nitric oxide-sensitive transcriptional repressor